MQTPGPNQTGQERVDGGQGYPFGTPQTLNSVQVSSLRRRERSDESWIEVSSRPSSSSLSSAADEIITDGLRVQHDSNVRRRRRSRGGNSRIQTGLGYRATSMGGGSSQEEYEESESESDRVMTSSNEALRPSPLQQELRRPSRNIYSAASSETMSEQEGDDEDDDDENATAVNYPRSTGRDFTPQPNAFSHPPTVQNFRPQTSTPPFSRARPSTRPSSQRHSYPAHQHSPYNVISPSYQADQDEALRASLSTLLSAAAAVRGLPKPGQKQPTQPHQGSAQVHPSSLRLVSEAVAMGEDPSSASNPSSLPSHRTTHSPSSVDKYKRKATPPSTVRSNSKDRRSVKKARKTATGLDEISPTLMTWVVSAGVVVLVSALSFSAGYVVGKEAGHAEAIGQIGSAGADAGRCGKEAASEIGRAGMGLRRLRLGAASGVRV